MANVLTDPAVQAPAAAQWEPDTAATIRHLLAVVSPGEIISVSWRSVGSCIRFKKTGVIRSISDTQLMVGWYEASGIEKLMCFPPPDLHQIFDISVESNFRPPSAPVQNLPCAAAPTPALQEGNPAGNTPVPPPSANRTANAISSFVSPTSNYTVGSVDLSTVHQDILSGIRRSMTSVCVGLRIPANLPEEEVLFYPHLWANDHETFISRLNAWFQSRFVDWGAVQQDQKMDMIALQVHVAQLTPGASKEELRQPYHLLARILGRAMDNSLTYKAPGLQAKLMRAFEEGVMDAAAILEATKIHVTTSRAAASVQITPPVAVAPMAVAPVAAAPVAVAAAPAAQSTPQGGQRRQDSFRRFPKNDHRQRRFRRRR